MRRKRYMARSFKVILEWDPEGQAYHVYVPSLPGCVSFGASREEAVAGIQEAIQGFLEVLEAEGLDIPDSDVEGERVTFICQGDYAIVMNSAIYAMKTLQKEMQGKFEAVGINSDDDINDLVNEIRQEIEGI